MNEFFSTCAAFIGDHRSSLIVGGLALTVSVLAVLVRRAVKSGRPDKWLTVVAQVLGYSWTGEAMWHIATAILHISPWFAGFAFFVFESMQFVQILRAERHQNLHGNPGKYGRAAWQVALVMSVVAALSGTTAVEVCLRFAVPILVTKLWWDGLTGDGVTEDSDAITWAWTPRRILVAIGLAKPGEQTLEAADRARQIRIIAKVTHRKHTTRSKWLRGRYEKRLGKLAMNADDAMLDDARATVERVWRADDRTRPLNPQEHTLISDAKAEIEAATASAAAADERAAAAETQQRRLQAMYEQTDRTAQHAQLQVETLQDELDRTRRQHEQQIAQLRHEMELAIQAAHTVVPVQGNGRNGHVNGFATVPAAGGARPMTTVPVGGGVNGDAAGETPLPQTPPACSEWLDLWVRVCQDEPQVALGQASISEDRAKEAFNVSIRHLRKVRNAARTGELRQRAEELQVALPDGYVDAPAAQYAA